MKIDPHTRLFSHSPVFQLACLFCCGILFASPFLFAIRTYIVGSAFAATTTIVGLYFDRLKVAGLALLSALFFAGAALAALELRTSPNRLRTLIERKAVQPAQFVELHGYITGPVEFANEAIRASVAVESLRTADSLMQCSGVVALQAWFSNPNDERRYRQLNLLSGSHLSFITQLNLSERYRNPGVSTLSEYLNVRDIDAIAVLKRPESITAIEEPTGFTLSGVLYRWRAFLQQQIETLFSRETAGVLDAALLGNRYNLSYATSERFREGGTFHVLVISGAHISFIGGLIFFFARRLTARRWLQSGGSVFIVWCYAVAVGAEISVVRAAVMFTFLMLGSFLYRRSSPLNSLGFAVLALLVWRPKDIFDPGFQLTFLSVLAILALAWPILRNLSDIGRWRPSAESPHPPVDSTLRSFCEALYWSENDWQRELQKSTHSYRLFKSPVAVWLERRHLQRGLRYTFAAIVVGVSVQLVLLPLQIVYFHRLSWSSLLLTIVVGGLLAILAFVAFLAMLVAQLHTGLATTLVKLAEAIDWLMTHSVDPFSVLGVASTRIPEYSGTARCLYFLYYLPLVFIAFKLSYWKPLSVSKPASVRVASLICIQLCLCLLLITHPFSRTVTSGRLEVNFLDVGHGDAALLVMPDGTTLLIDGGGQPAFGGREGERPGVGERVVSEYLWARGFDAVDYVLATHADADHIEGLNAVVRNFKVRSAIVARSPLDDAGYAQFNNTLNQEKTPLQTVHAGDVLRYGEVEIEVLWPPPAAPLAPSRNNDSIVLRVRFGERIFLFTGDIEKRSEAFLSAHAPLRADVVKVPHHGSKSSSTLEFVTAARPTLAVISVGQTSMFGHPHQEVVERWRNVGAEVITTGHSGTIMVTTDGRDLQVNRFVRE